MYYNFCSFDAKLSYTSLDMAKCKFLDKKQKDPCFSA